jgi:hypothetical protein
VRLEELYERVDQLTERLDQVARTMNDLVGQMSAFGLAMNQQTGRLSNVWGEVMELRYRNHAAGYFGQFLRRCRVMPAETLTALAEDAADAGTLSADEAADLLLADLVLEGRLAASRQPARILAEVSGMVERSDVERALRRSALLGLAAPDGPVVPVAAGEVVAENTLGFAADLGVKVVLDRRTRN